jgi:hypothetical protein
MRGFLLLLACIAFFHVTNVNAQATLGARPVALGRATTALPNSPWSVFENPAMINKKRPQASFFAIRYYGISALTDIAAVITWPAEFGIVGGGAHRYGSDLFNKTRIRVVYANAYQRFHYGAAIHYNHVVQGGPYGSLGAFGIDVGVSALITKGLWIGAKATNINEPSYGHYGRDDKMSEDLARNLSIGFSYQLSDVALFTTDVVKDVDFLLSYRAGLEVKLIKNLKARAGITTAPQTFSGGFGYNTKYFGADIVIQKNSENALGYSPGIDINISW